MSSPGGSSLPPPEPPPLPSPASSAAIRVAVSVRSGARSAWTSTRSPSFGLPVTTVAALTRTTRSADRPRGGADRRDDAPELLLVVWPRPRCWMEVAVSERSLAPRSARTSTRSPELRVAGDDGLGVDSDHAARDRPGGGADRLDEAPELELVSGGVLLADAVGHGISVGIEVKTDLDEVAESRRADEDGRVVDGEGPTADRPGRVGGLLDGALEFLVFARLLRAPRHDPRRSAVRAADADFRGLKGTDRRRGQGDLRHHPDAEVRAGVHEAAGAGKRRVAVELDADAEDFHAPAVGRQGRDLPLEGEGVLPFHLRSIHPEAAVGFPRPDAKGHRASGSQVRRGQDPPGNELGHASRQAEMLGHAHEGQIVARDRSDGAGPPAGAGRRERGGGREQERKRQDEDRGCSSRRDHLDLLAAVSSCGRPVR